MLVNAEPFTGVIDQYRLLTIGGKLGGHKTSHALALAEPYLRDGYRLVSNLSCIWNDEPKNVTLNSDGKLKVIVIQDEAGLEIKSRFQIEEVAAYARKMDLMLFYPSFWPTPRMANILRTQALFGLKSAGIPCIIYKWTVTLGGFKDGGFYLWFNPQNYYGLYSSNDPGTKLRKVQKFLLDRKDEFRALWHADEDEDEEEGTGKSISGLAIDEKTSLLIESLEGLEETTNNLLSVSRRKGKRGRY